MRFVAAGSEGPDNGGHPAEHLHCIQVLVRLQLILWQQELSKTSMQHPITKIQIEIIEGRCLWTV